jgi:hypothetical protein
VHGADDKHSTVTYPDPVRVSVIDLISAPATFVRHRGWSLRPFLRAGRKRKPDRGEIVVRGISVDAIALGICPHGDRVSELTDCRAESKRAGLRIR